ncbi:MAG: rRNA pseudouridine synthase, partial [Verrucomicrobia bacterium]|nr:rRNA pseudouridine synthase [Verrucomicrobiota bacterium]
MEFPMRLNRYLSACGLGSRRGTEALITEGRVKINDEVCVNLGTKVAASDQVAVNGRPVRLAHDLVVALHKPVGYVCTRA